MPVYKYQCNICKTVFEQFNSVKNRNDIECPKCELLNVKILIQPTNFMMYGLKQPKVYSLPDDFKSPEHDVDTKEAEEYFNESYD